MYRTGPTEIVRFLPNAAPPSKPPRTAWCAAKTFAQTCSGRYCAEHPPSPSRPQPWPNLGKGLEMAGWIDPDKEAAAARERILAGFRPGPTPLRSTTRQRLRLCQRVSALQPELPAPHRALPVSAPDLLPEIRRAQPSDLQVPVPAPAGPVFAPGGN